MYTQCLLDIDMHAWPMPCEETQKLDTYGLYKSNFGFETYLDTIDKLTFRKAIV